MLKYEFLVHFILLLKKLYQNLELIEFFYEKKTFSNDFLIFL